MLVLTRRPDQGLHFPQLGISVEVRHVSKNTVQLGVTAPSDVLILRQELTDKFDSENGLPTPSMKSDQTRKADATDNTREKWQPRQRTHTTIIDQHRLTAAPLDRLLKNQSTEKGRTRKVLLVEDNPNEAKLLASYLRLRDFSVDIAEDGAAAMETLKSSALPDCILLDMTMPRFDGSWTINQIRKSDCFSHLPVYAVSGNDPQEYGIAIGPAGVNRWFSKPLDPSQIVRHVVADSFRLFFDADSASCSLQC